jgi:hypothetical protein
LATINFKGPENEGRITNIQQASILEAGQYFQRSGFPGLVQANALIPAKAGLGDLLSGPHKGQESCGADPVSKLHTGQAEAPEYD